MPKFTLIVGGLIPKLEWDNKRLGLNYDECHSLIRASRRGDDELERVAMKIVKRAHPTMVVPNP